MVVKASVVGILNGTESEQWEVCVTEVVWMCHCLWRVDGLRVCYCETEGEQWCSHSARKDPG